MTDIPARKPDPGHRGRPAAMSTGEPRAAARLPSMTQLRDYGLVFALALITLFFEYTTGGVLFQPLNLTNLILQNSYVVVMALGMLLVIVAGHIDLSIGSVVGFVGALAALLMVRFGSTPTATVLCLAWSAPRSAGCRATSSPISASRASSSRWPACWSSAA